MEKIISNDKIHELVALPKNFDLDLIDQEAGFNSKIFTVISREQFESLEVTNESVYNSIAKAGILYSLVLDIPRIKVYISNFGINQYSNDNTRVAPWWDIRDLGLSWLKKANESLFKSLREIEKDAILSNSNLFFKNQFSLIDIFQFQKFYPIGNSVDVYNIIVGIMQEELDVLMSLLGDCTINELKADPRLLELLKKYLLNQAIFGAVGNPAVVFLTSGLAIQYEELPWQKSIIISPDMLYGISQQYQRKAEMYLQMLIQYIQDHKDLFPCYQLKKSEFKTKIISKDSGLYL